MLEELILETAMRDHRFCLNDDCIEYQCQVAPRYVEDGQTWTLSLPCLSFVIACPDATGQLRNETFCDFGRFSIESISNGLIIRVEDE